jgi:hypothetical protein
MAIVKLGGELVRELRVLEVRESWRCDAGLEQPVVQPRRRPGTEVCRNRVVQRAERLDGDEGRANRRKRCDEAASLLNGRDQDAHRNRKAGREESAHGDERPPGQRQRRCCAEQHHEEAPLGCATQAGQSASVEKTPSAGIARGAVFVITGRREARLAARLALYPPPRSRYRGCIPLGGTK